MSEPAMLPPLAPEPESRGIFELLFQAKRTDRRQCDEDQLTAALAASCRLLPCLGVHLAQALFGRTIAIPGAGQIRIQEPDTHPSGCGVRYDLLLGAGRALEQLGLVVENKVE
jgi:hypothetical protein